MSDDHCGNQEKDRINSISLNFAKIYFDEPQNGSLAELGYKIYVNEVKEGLISAEIIKLIEKYTDGALKLLFKKQTLPNFWAHLQIDFLKLSKRYLKVFMPFVMTYLCKKSLSALNYLENKYINHFKNMESEYKFNLLTQYV